MTEPAVSLSPLQMKHLVYTKVRVELSTGLEEAEKYWAPNFDLEGVELFTEVTVGYPDNEAEDPRKFMVSLRFAILNEAENKKQAPYTIDIQAQGWFEVRPEVAITARTELVRVNGASMILGAMRELVSQLTARSGFGPLLLPTLRFHPQQSAGPTNQKG